MNKKFSIEKSQSNENDNLEKWISELKEEEEFIEGEVSFEVLERSQNILEDPNRHA